jgi:hypothetical protein
MSSRTRPRLSQKRSSCSLVTAISGAARTRSRPPPSLSAEPLAPRSPPSSSVRPRNYVIAAATATSLGRSGRATATSRNASRRLLPPCTKPRWPRDGNTPSSPRPAPRSTHCRPSRGERRPSASRLLRGLGEGARWSDGDPTRVLRHDRPAGALVGQTGGVDPTLTSRSVVALRTSATPTMTHS